MKKETIKQVNFALHVIATHYMQQYQGDILLDQASIIDTLDENGEIELYVATTHFDTENRFRHYSPEIQSLEDGRKVAREIFWGDYIVTLYKRGDNITIGIEDGAPNRERKPFPIDRFDGMTIEFDKRANK